MISEDKSTKRVCRRCNRVYQGSANSNVCKKCNLVQANKILREALNKIRENPELSDEQKRVIIGKAIDKIV